MSSQGHLLRSETQSHSRFELMSIIPFSTAITVTVSVSLYGNFISLIK